MSQRIDGSELTQGDRVGFYLTKDGKLKSLESHTETAPPDAQLGGVYRVVKPNESDSRILALQIEAIKEIIREMDFDYMATSIVQLREMANNYDATAVLNRDYRPEQSDLFGAQAEAMSLLLRFRSALIKCDDLKKRSERAKDNFRRLSAAFGG